MTTPPCPLCDGPSRRVEVPGMCCRRGDRAIIYTGIMYQCLSSCGRFSCGEASEESARRSHTAWLAVYGEPHPDLRRPRPGRRHTDIARIRMDPEDLERLEALSIALDQTRSEVVRDLIAAAHRTLSARISLPTPKQVEAMRGHVPPDCGEILSRDLVEQGQEAAIELGGPVRIVTYPDGRVEFVRADHAEEIK